MAGYRFVQCSVDSKLVVDWVAAVDTNFNPYGNIIEDIRVLMRRDWACTLQHTLREGNFCADLLVKTS